MVFLVNFEIIWGFPFGSDSKESAWEFRDTRDMGLIPRSGRFPGEGNGSPLQYSCLENPVDRGAGWATVNGVAELDTIEWLKHRLLCPWDSPGKNTGVDGHFLLRDLPNPGIKPASLVSSCCVLTWPFLYKHPKEMISVVCSYEGVGPVWFRTLFNPNYLPKSQLLSCHTGG